jgi:hypothetical protein
VLLSEITVSGAEPRLPARKTMPAPTMNTSTTTMATTRLLSVTYTSMLFDNLTKKYFFQQEFDLLGVFSQS